MAKSGNKAGSAGSKAGAKGKAKGDYLADVPSRVVSGTMGLAAFAMAAVVGLWAGNPAIVTLSRALVACAVCALVGRILGSMGESCTREFIGYYKKQNPRPRLPEELQKLEMSRAAHAKVVDEMRKKAA
ncbi:MAG: hypothetical protein KC996_10845 [Phycisphaerales bacterium]|nr:hypothetical protein [Phycisphaerales bacterium]